MSNKGHYMNITKRRKMENPNGRHPSHLRGKQIGLFYARKNKERKGKVQQDLQPLATVKISNEKQQQIKEILSNPSLENLYVLDDDSYAHIEDSDFKRKFLSTIRGNIVEKLSNIIVERERITKLDEDYYNELKSKPNDKKYVDMLKKRTNLPSFSKKEEILKSIEENQVIVISGETGCGKTTQIAQFILDDFIENKNGSLCKVICTQPRRISAISVAERVANERAERLGHSVGYHIRLEKELPRDKGAILFCTTGVILRQMESDPSLGSVSHLILDEIHERNEASDFLITLLREVLKKRKDLKVILMSATLNSEAFSKYYNDCPHINIPGFTYPVQQYFLEDILQEINFQFPDSGDRKRFKRKRNEVESQEEKEFNDYILPYVRQLQYKKYPQSVCEELRKRASEELNIDFIFELINNICGKDKNNGTILVFLPGMMNISSLHKRLMESGKFPSSKYILIPLHSLMPTIEQKQIFEPAPSGKRKIIISTNIAETSITIDDVIYVIDCGRIKMTDFVVSSNTETLNCCWVSKANADQRKGRAGRVQPGVCYHLYTKARYEILEKFMKPEILRKRLDGTILTSKILQLGPAEKFFSLLMDPPESESVKLSLELLKRMEALNNDEDLTPLGYHLARLPMAPQMGKMILFGAIFSCLDPILSIAATLDFKDAFQVPLGKEKEADRRRKDLAQGIMSDHIMFHKVLNDFNHVYNKRQFCWEYFLNQSTLKLLQNMKKQFMQNLHDLKFVSDLEPSNEENNKNSGNLSLIKAVICAGLYPNVSIIRLNKHGNLKTLRAMDFKSTYKFHPKSVLSDMKRITNPLLVYYTKVKSTSDYIHDATLIHPLPVIFFGDRFTRLEQDGVNEIITIGDHLRFKCDSSSAQVIHELRERLNWFLGYKIAHPGVVNWQDENTGDVAVLRAIGELVTIEDVGEIFTIDDDEYVVIDDD